MNPFDNIDTGIMAQRATANTITRLSAAGMLTPRLGGQQQAARPIPFNGLLTNRVLAGLSGSDLSRLLPYLASIALPPGKQLNAYGQHAEFVYFPETAVISHIYFLADGSTAAASIVGNDGMVGLSAIFDSAPPAYWIEVTLGGTALRVRSEVIKKEFRQGGSLQQLLLNCITARLAQVSQKAVCNGCHDLQKRLATWLLMLADRSKLDELPLTQEMMANHLGTRRATVNISCTALRENGIVKYRRGLVTILDRAALESVACECYTAL